MCFFLDTYGVVLCIIILRMEGGRMLVSRVLVCGIMLYAFYSVSWLLRLGLGFLSAVLGLEEGEGEGGRES